MRPPLHPALVALVCLVSFAAFLPALGADWVNGDDPENFLKNEGYRGLGRAQLRWMFTAFHMGHYHPLTWMTLGADFAIWGLNPFGFHLTSLLLHSAAAVAFLHVARRLLRAAQPAGAGEAALGVGATAAALLFAVHPLRVESVVWISERRDVLSGLLYLMAVLAYLEAVAARAAGAVPRGRRWYGASLVLFVAALLSKALVVSLPVVLVILDVYPLRRLGGATGWGTAAARRVWVEKVPFVLLALAATVVAFLARAPVGAAAGLQDFGIAERVLLSLYGYAFYLGKTLFPYPLSPLYEMSESLDLSSTPVLGSAGAVLLLAAGSVALRRRWPALCAAAATYAVTLLPVIGVVQSGPQIAADRYTYLACLGWALLFGAAVVWVLRRREEGRVGRGVMLAVLAASVLATAGLGYGAWEQSRIWRDSESLWRVAVAADPRCVVCRNNLGHSLLAQGRHREAELEFRVSGTLRGGRAAAHNNLGTALAYQGRYTEAEGEFAEAMRLSPRLADAPANLGALHARQGRYLEAIPLLRRALALAPDFPGARVNLAHTLKNQGAALVRAGRLAEALALFAEAVQLSADDADTFLNLGRVLMELGREREALAPLERAVAVAPRDGPARFWLARALLRSGDLTGAARHAAVLDEIDPALGASLRSADPSFPLASP
ncbi:MAG: tetratricopeptide repeat protein [Candidatus Rokubacteria bacterium]|nr:tetratricopeptide repeat protein [Candidatus Rokubacteria bacterium]